jgi:hypothetical protein
MGRALALGGALASLCATPGLADQGGPIQDGPISLTNADVDRLHAQQAKSDARAAEKTPPPEVTAPTEAELQAMRELDQKLRARLDRISTESMDELSRTLDERAVGAVRAGPASMPAISAGPEAQAAPAMPAAPAPPAAPADADPQASSAPVADPEPACIYGPRGRLVFEPEGRSCAAIRVGRRPQLVEPTKASAAAAERREGQVGCVYGSRGQLLYASPGVECAG